MGTAFACTVNWLAVTSAPPTYRVEEEILVSEGSCSETFVDLEHDAAAGTLAFDYGAGAGS